MINIVKNFLTSKKEKDSSKDSSSVAYRQIYQFTSKPTPALTDILPLSNEESAHAASQCTFQQLLTNTLNPNIQIGISQVTSLTDTLNALDLNVAYGNTAGQNFTIGSGLNIIGDSLNFISTDTSLIQFNGAYQSIYNPVDQGVNGTWFNTEARGNTTGTVAQLISIFSGGFNYQTVTGSESSFLTWEIFSQGSVTPISYFKGADATYNNSYVGFENCNVNIGKIFNDSRDLSAILAAYSTTQGVLLCPMSMTDRDAIGSPVQGLEIYNTTYSTKDIYDGTDYQNVATFQNLLQGANINLTDNLNGTLTISSTGGGGGGQSGQSGFRVINNTTNTTFGSNPTPALVSSGTLIVSSAINFSPTLSAGTLDIQNLSGANGYVQYVITLNVVGTTSTPNNYTFWAVTNNGSFSFLNRVRVFLNDSVTPKSIALGGITQLSSLGSLQIWITNTSNSDAILVQDICGEVLNTNQFGGVQTSDDITQGTNNIFLSTNAGSTYENTTGVLNVGNIVTFATVGGRIQDGGVIGTASRKSASDNSKSIVSSVFGATVAGNLLKAADTNGTSQDSGIAATSVATAITSSTVTGSTQSSSVNNRYYINYTGGQCVVTLPTAAGTNSVVELVGLSTASTSGWKINAQSSDKIQFASTLGAANGSLTSTPGSATDCATLRDVAVNLWVVYPALGLNLAVA